MALIRCPECGKEISEMASSRPACVYSIDRVGVETEQERVNVRVKNFFIFGVYYF